jgi:hypothetical protein
MANPPFDEDDVVVMVLRAAPKTQADWDLGRLKALEKRQALLQKGASDAADAMRASKESELQKQDVRCFGWGTLQICRIHFYLFVCAGRLALQLQCAFNMYCKLPRPKNAQGHLETNVPI